MDIALGAEGYLTLFAPVYGYQYNLYFGSTCDFLFLVCLSHMARADAFSALVVRNILNV